MPNAVIQNIHKETNIPIDELESIWNKAVKQAENEKVKDVYAYANGVLQNINKKHRANDTAEFKIKYKDSNRSIDGNGYMRIKDCILTASEVNQYLGAKITNYKMLGLDPSKFYNVYRPLEEITKALGSYNTIPLVDDHVEVTKDNPNKHKWLGTTGSNARIENDELINDITIWTQNAMDYIDKADNEEDGGKKGLSCGYTYDLILEQGSHNGVPYDIVQRNIEANHVALVSEPRIARAQVGDVADNITKLKKGAKFMKFNINKLLRALAKDSTCKATDADKEVAKAILDKARDADYEGKEDQLLEEVSEMIAALQEVQKEEPAEAVDEEAEPEGNKERAAPEKSNQEGEAEAKDDEEEKKKENAEDSKDSFITALSLSQKILGRVSNDLISQGKTSVIINETLKAKGYATDGKSFAEKMAYMKFLAETPAKAKVHATAQDNKQSVVATGKLFNPLNRKA